MSNPSGKPRPLSRRQFVTLVAAGSAALMAPGAGSAAPAPAHPRARGAARPAGAVSATDRELARQRASTLETLKTIRGHVMPPGTELGFVFRARRPARRGD